MAQGNIKANKWNLVINAKKETPSTDIMTELEGVLTDINNNNTAKYYFAIIHDKDKDELGKPKRPHLHLVLEYAEKYTLTAVLEQVMKLYGLNNEQIGIDVANSAILAEQYLIHKNDPSKYQYDRQDIHTNNRTILDDRLDAKYLTPEERAIEQERALKEAKTFTEFVDRAGCEFANKYRATYKELQTEKRQDIDGLYERLNGQDTLLRNVMQRLNQLSCDIEMFEMTPKDILDEIKKLLKFYDK